MQDFFIQKLNENIAFLEQAEVEIDNGRIVRLENFEKEIIKLCASLQNSRVEDAVKYTPLLAQIMEKLGSLEDKMRERQQGIKDELKGLTGQQKATSAYSKAAKTENQE